MSGAVPVDGSKCVAMLKMLFHDVFAGRSCFTPTRYQFQTTECGVAVLGKILAHYGCHVPLEELRAITGVTRDAITAGQILSAARHYGLDAKAQRCEPDDLPRLGFPAIVHLRFIHFSVIEGMTDQHVLLNDPHNGRIDRPSRLFHEEFTGIVLTFRPGPAFRKRPAQDVALLRPAMGWGGAAILAATLLCSGFAAGLLVAFAGALGAHQPVLWLALSYLVAVAAIAAGLAGLAAWLDRRITTRLAAHVLRLAPHVLRYRLAGDVSACLNLGRAIADSLAREILPRCVPLIGVPVILWALWQLDRGLGAIISMAVVVYLVALALVLPWRFGRHAPQPGGDIAFYDALAQKIVQPARWKLGQGPAQMFRGHMGALARDHIRRHTQTVPIALLLVLRALAVPMFGGLALMYGGNLQAVILALALAVILRGVDALHRHLHDLSLQTFLARDLLQATARPAQAASRCDPAATDPMICVDGVSFAYAPQKPALIRDMTLHVGKGEQLGMTGPSGGGKSTLGRLIAGLDLPLAGQITIGGHAADQAKIGWVDKRPVLFTATLRENLTLWQDDRGDDALWQALHLACLDDIIAARGGLDIAITRDGRDFSGGQLQRLEIARAIVAGNQVLVLDEAVDALDPQIEARMRTRLRAHGMTLVVISHRASTLAACDRVLHIVQGQLHDAAKGASVDQPPRAKAAYQTGGPDADPMQKIHGLAQVASQIAGRPIASSATTLPALYSANHGYWRNLRFTQPDWWRADHGTVLALRQSDNTAIAVDGAGKAALGPLQPQASMHYPPPSRRLTGFASLLRAGFGTDAVDIALLIGAAIVAGLAMVALLLAPQDPSRIIAAIGVMTASTAAAAVLGLRISLGVETAMNAALMHHMIRSDATALRNLPEERAQAAINAIAQIIATVQKSSLAVIGPLGAGCGALAVIVAWGDRAAVQGAVGLTICAAVIIAIMEMLRQYTLAAVRHARVQNAHLRNQMISGQSRLRALGAFGDVMAVWCKHAVALRSTQTRLDLVTAANDAILTGLPWGAAALMAATMPDPSLMLMAWLGAWGIAETVRAGAQLWGALSQARVLAPILSLPEEPSGAPAPALLQLATQGLGRVYDTRPVLHDINITIASGQITAIGGSSGSGKTTLLRQLLGFETADQGQICLDGRPLGQIDIATFRQRVIAIEQGASLGVASTLRSQIAGASVVGPDDIWAVLDEVGIADEVLAMPMGLQTIIDEAAISTGQMQRLLIAAALLRKPDILILDEALSAVPDALQDRLIAAFRRRAITVILVTHRQSAIAMADRLIFLSQGSVCYDGTASDGLRHPTIARVLAQEKIV
jgi:ABC-type bacteriocin/lantibiotic exporter with double-glycine peptidase domain